VVFPYKLGDKLRMCKRRNIADKHDTKPTSTGQEPCLFGWHVIPENYRVGYITEGELDAVAMYQYGFPALSVPFGGGTGEKQRWVENEYHNLERFDEIVLCLDQDEQGKAGTVEIIKRLGADRCKVATLPRKDANQCLIDGVSREEFTKAIREAKSLDPEELKSASAYHGNVIKMFYPDGSQEPGFFAPWPKVRSDLYFRWNEVTILNGINGHGKSQMAGHLVLSALSQGEKACIASMEFKPERLLKRLYSQAAGLTANDPTPEYLDAIGDWLADGLWVFECTGTAKAKRILEVFRYAYKRYGIRVFVIDSLLKCGFAEDDYSGQKLFVESLCDFKNEFDVHVFLITHSKKGESEYKPSGKFDVKGTGAITDLADTVLNCWKNKKKHEKLAQPEEGDDLDEVDAMPDAILEVLKQRNGDYEGRISLWFDKNCFQFLGNHGDRLWQYVRFYGGNHASA